MSEQVTPNRNVVSGSQRDWFAMLRTVIWIFIALLAFVFSPVAVMCTDYISQVYEITNADSVSAFSAIFTAFAFIFAVVTLITELRKMRDDDAKQEENRNHERKTAAVSALTVLADWQYRMMMQDSVELQNAHRDKCQEFARRALAIVNELSSEGSQSSEVVILSPLDVFERRLKSLRSMLEQTRQFRHDKSKEIEFSSHINYLANEYAVVKKINDDLKLAIIKDVKDHYVDATNHLRNCCYSTGNSFEDKINRMLEECDRWLGRLKEITNGSRVSV